MRHKWTRLVLIGMFTATMAITSLAGPPGWKQTSDGKWWYSTSKNTDTKWLVNGWVSDDVEGGMHKFYYVDEYGYLLTSCVTPDGHEVNEKGELVQNGQVVLHPRVPEELVPNLANSNGSSGGLTPETQPRKQGWVQTEDGQWKYGLKRRWLIGGNWISAGTGEMDFYFFDESGVMLSNTTLDDGRQFNADGKWIVDGVVQRSHIISPRNVVSEAAMNEALAEKAATQNLEQMEQTYNGPNEALKDAIRVNKELEDSIKNAREVLQNSSDKFDAAVEKALKDHARYLTGQ